MQRPRIEKVPPYATTAGPECIELAASAGLFLDPWQRYVLKGGLGEREDGRWAAFEVAEIVSRQNGKGSIFEARELGGLYLFGSRLILHSAHEFKTAAEGFRRIMALIDNTDDLRKRVKKVINSHGEEGVELLNGARLRFVARSRGSGRGFSVDDLMLDEAFNLSPESVAAMLPTLSARPNPQIWYASSAPLVDSIQLRHIQKRGRNPKPGDALAYFEFSAPPDADLDDPAAWAQANPALGYRLGLDFVQMERHAMGDVEFARERLSIEEDPELAGLFDMLLWAELSVRGGVLEDPICLAVDTTPERSHTSIGSAGLLGDSLLGVDVIDDRPGTGWVVERVVSLWKRHKACAVVIDERSAAAMFIQDLRNRKVPVEVANTAGMAEATAQFYGRCLPDALTLRHPGIPALTAAVSGAKKRDIGDGGAWAFTRRDVTVNVSPLIAVTLAAWGHGKFASRKGAKPMIVYA